MGHVSQTTPRVPICLRFAVPAPGTISHKMTGLFARMLSAFSYANCTGMALLVWLSSLPGDMYSMRGLKLTSSASV
ncbi:hypothetical protein PSFL111601_04070 [Pseudomonas floridensis]